MKDILKLIRPQQWIKNLFVFIPMFFSSELFNTGVFVNTLIMFVAFGFTASSIYCYNDIVDADDDRNHPEKCHRPIAAGKVSVGTAYRIMAVMFVLSVGTALFLPATLMPSAMAVLLFYYVMNLAYCSRLKQYAIIDVCIIAFGFVLRILAGGIVGEIVLSKWIVLMTFLLTLFLSFAKRRDDVIRMNETGEAPRKNTTRYNLTFINQAVTITASVTLVCYIMYTVSPEVARQFGTENLYLTSVFVLLGLLRYIQITVVDKRSGDPTKVIMHDRFSQFVLIAWGLAFLVMIYL